MADDFATYEEYEPVRRYKAFRAGPSTDTTLTLQSALTGSSFAVGVVYERPPHEKEIWPKVRVHKSGFHACALPHQCFWGGYGYSQDRDVLCEVELYGQRDVSDSKEVECAEMVRIVRVFSAEEKIVLLQPAAKTTSRDGTERWLKNGVLHREDDLPAVRWLTGSMEWWVNGNRHRTNGKPAYITIGRREWWETGERHRDKDLPAVEDDNLCQHQWFVRNQPTRAKPGDHPVVTFGLI
jgi:hypothetical protein